MDAVWVALIVAVIGPLLLSYLNGRQRSAEKREDNKLRREAREEDYRRQDEVAARLLRNTTEATEKLDVIHTLVDGTMTATMRSRLSALVSQRALTKEIIELKKANGQESSPSRYAGLDALQKEIDKLVMEIDARDQQDALAKQQEKDQAEKRKREEQ